MKNFKIKELLNYLVSCKNKYYELSKNSKDAYLNVNLRKGIPKSVTLTYKNVKDWFKYLWYSEFRDKVFPTKRFDKEYVENLQNENENLKLRIEALITIRNATLKNKINHNKEYIQNVLEHIDYAKDKLKEIRNNG